MNGYGKKLEHDLTTGQFVERDLTIEEITVRDAARADAEALLAIAQQKEQAAENDKAELRDAKLGEVLAQIAADLAAVPAAGATETKQILGRLLQHQEKLIRVLSRLI